MMKGFKTWITICLAAVAVMFVSLTNRGNAGDTTYKIGDIGPGDGWVFYDKGNSKGGWRYLEVAPEDLDRAHWGCTGKSVKGAKGTTTGDGKANTLAILKSCKEESTAVKLVSAYRGGGKDDWFLPSKDELGLIYKNLVSADKGNFPSFLKSIKSGNNLVIDSNDFYWSSSEINSDSAWIYSLTLGHPSELDMKEEVFKVRPVRAF